MLNSKCWKWARAFSGGLLLLILLPACGASGSAPTARYDKDLATAVPVNEDCAPEKSQKSPFTSINWANCVGAALGDFPPGYTVTVHPIMAAAAAPDR
jgi:hypothetical protein